MNFEFRNVTDDNELQALVSQARDLMQGVTADDFERRATCAASFNRE